MTRFILGRLHRRRMLGEDPDVGLEAEVLEALRGGRFDRRIARGIEEWMRDRWPGIARKGSRRVPQQARLAYVEVLKKLGEDLPE